MTRRVPGAVQHVQRALADLHLIPIVQPLRGVKVLGLRKAEHLALLRQGLIQ